MNLNQTIVELLRERAEWWIVPRMDRFGGAQASEHMSRLSHDPLFFQTDCDWFEYSSWLCLFEAELQLTEGQA